MSWILSIETATPVCSVCLSKGADMVALRETLTPQSHAAILAPFVQEVLQEAGIQAAELDAVVISKGPGSYTGLRIGVSTAKGICYALDKPLVSVSTPRAMAYGAIQAHLGYYRYCPMIDARRMEVYLAFYDNELHIDGGIEAKIIETGTLDAVLDKGKVLFFGDGAAKCKDILSKHPNAFFDTDFTPSAVHLARIGYERFLSGIREDVAYFEPFYLKDFIAGPPKVKGLF